MTQDGVNRLVILLMAVGISALFLAMIQQFLMAIFLAGIFSALSRPLYLRLRRFFGGRRHPAALLTLLTMIVMVLAPLALLIAVVVAQAIDVSQSVTPWVRETLREPSALWERLQGLPFYDQLLPHREQIVQQAGDLVSGISRFLVDGISSVTLGTANFVFMAFVLLYTLYFFQMDGDKLVRRILYYLPLKSTDEQLMLEKFTSVTRATLKGTVLIGVLQGGLAGLAFAVAGIDNAVFWGTVMAVLSIIPSVGSALVWVPAVIILASQGQVGTAVALGVFCGLVVGSLDNVLRPILVGKDTKMHELLIFFGTLGGLFMFGISGVFIGPLIASLFVTIWEMYGVEFEQILPDVEGFFTDDHPAPEAVEAEPEPDPVDPTGTPRAEEALADATEPECEPAGADGARA